MKIFIYIYYSFIFNLREVAEVWSSALDGILGEHLISNEDEWASKAYGIRLQYVGNPDWQRQKQKFQESND